MKLKNYWNRISDDVLKIIRIIIAIVSLLLTIALLRWLELKGFFGLLIGMLLMAFLILSKNPLLLAMVRIFHARDYINELLGGKDEEENKKQ